MKITVRTLTAAFTLFAGIAAARAEELAPLYPAPDFKLTDQHGQTVTKADLKGKTWVVDFIFTRCPSACPVMTQKMIALAKKVTDPNVRFVGISVDPAYDTPAVLTKYARLQGATDPRMIFLTGDAATIFALINKDGFRAYAVPATGDKPIIHDEHFILVDQAGMLRNVYTSNDAGRMTQLAADLATVAAGRPLEAPPDQGPSLTTAPSTRPAEGPNAALLRAFPAMNATLNATSGILLCLAMMMIQAKRVRAHAALMIAAVVASTLFLASYLTYHYMKAGVVTKYPDVKFKSLYYVVLVSHTILAVVVIPLVIVTLKRAWRRQWDHHRRIARPTFWIWLYVSATGVLVYWMLYQLAPRLAAAGAGA
jgi:protein SCO1/2/putative membrane protein